MNFILFDEIQIRQSLLPLTFTRPVSEIRIGIQTISEKWQDFLVSDVSFYTQDYLQAKYPLVLADDNVFINGAVCPTALLTEAILGLAPATALVQGELILAYRSKTVTDVFDDTVDFEGDLRIIRQAIDIYTHNGEQIMSDFQRITKNRTSQPINDRFTAFYNESQIFIEEGVELKAVVLDASNGPIYLGKGVNIQAGALIQGPFAICEDSVINMGAKMRRNTTIGPFSKVGGEISNSVIFGNSNKGHEGFMGNSVIGEWCNWGADTNNSNLKNDYSKVELWSYVTNRYENTGSQFVGLIMADHSKCGINTMFNTGTVVGVNCNIFGADFQPKHIPSFSWSNGNGTFKTYHLRKANQVARAVLERRGKEFDGVEEQILKAVFEQTSV
ncbi:MULTISPECIES: GlmU family protein [unclassified Arcicella]|uniref:GlmU family protein n=1 Tax=unclassified Arcicella TaxID=2644986 RepID=UPI002863C4AB|nr:MULTISPECIES: GlmU family protein [unclassified Arcicella]MDR6560546.1 UDP-N-acetylglucosamine diphosphorylase/glucosamine-1-phosphate N-acetyltransferase [Arcicella sp. BE51]MDR6809848.1 UDP-N-acetylglucosamine diphosphorylase/glucosamine-1-phosphate N-acetyltransferase [Arcicella sp. BE140]MDR6821197.1 UDP-N-acetylglucosamine diphosphorylase/glucosamine-1-phosphate N-acetyltransferase [Arcicella sp. BE139]